MIVGAGVGERLDAVAGVRRGGPGGREAALPPCYVVQLAGAPSTITITTTTTLSPRSPSVTWCRRSGTQVYCRVWNI